MLKNPSCAFEACFAYFEGTFVAWYRDSFLHTSSSFGSTALTVNCSTQTSGDLSMATEVSYSSLIEYLH